MSFPVSSVMAGVPTPPPSPPLNSLDDIFGSAPSSPVLPQSSPLHDFAIDETRPFAHYALHHHQHPSDIPRLRATHVTNGYREGIAASKERHMQEGFDEGYELGGEIGLRAGWCLAVLEGICAAVEGRRRRSGDDDEMVTRVRETMVRADEELRVERLMGSEFFGPEGVWSYEVPGREGDGDLEIRVSFREVAACHPLLQKWGLEVGELAARAGLTLDKGGDSEKADQAAG